MAEEFYIDRGKKRKLKPTGKRLSLSSSPILPTNHVMPMPLNFAMPYSSPDPSNLYIEFEDKFGSNVILTEEFLIRFENEPSENDLKDMINDTDLNINREFLYRKVDRKLPLYLFRQHDYSNAISKINQITERKGILNAMPNFRFRISKSELPKSDEFERQWIGYNSYGTLINLFQAWDITKGSDTITVAVIDDGIDQAHNEFSSVNKFAQAYNAIDESNVITVFRTESHGTCCAGIISADYSPHSGICGVAPGCKLMAVKVADVRGDDWTDISTLIRAIDYVSDKADVINCSWGCSDYSDLRDKIADAAASGRSNNKGCVFCVSSGNFFGAYDNRFTRFPGLMDEVITVSACNNSGEWEYFPNGWGSCSGPDNEVDICAPGYEIVTTDLTGSDGWGSGDHIMGFWGTSAAAPHVSGVAALILSINPNLSSREVKDIITSTASKSRNFGSNNYDELEGFGVVNVAEAVRKAQTVVPL